MESSRVCTCLGGKSKRIARAINLWIGRLKQMLIMQPTESIESIDVALIILDFVVFVCVCVCVSAFVCAEIETKW